MAMLGKRDMDWRETCGFIMALVDMGVQIVDANGFAERPEEWVYARLAHENPHRYAQVGSSLYSVDAVGRLVARMWKIAPAPMAWCLANGRTGAVEWWLGDDDRITFKLDHSKLVYRLVESPRGMEPVVVYKAGPDWCLETDSLCWNLADRLAERVTRDRRLAAMQRAV